MRPPPAVTPDPWPTPADAARFPTTRYRGSKAKLVDWIWAQLSQLEFDSCLDAFAGTGCVAYRFKQAGRRVVFNDLLRFNHQVGLALIENDTVRLEEPVVEQLLTAGARDDGPSFIAETFRGIYFTDEENRWLDRVCHEIATGLTEAYQQALAYYALAQACLVKRPYNLFHRKNLYLRLANVPRSFGNKAAWDRPFPDWFAQFAAEANQAVFPGRHRCQAWNRDALALEPEPAFDLVYLDPPYLPRTGAGIEYRDLYHFLEGLVDYSRWPELVDWRSRHRRLRPEPSPWSAPTRIRGAFRQLFETFRRSILVVSYRSDGRPSVEELIRELERVGKRVRVATSEQYQYALSTNRRSREVLLIGE